MSRITIELVRDGNGARRWGFLIDGRLEPRRGLCWTHIDGRAVYLTRWGARRAARDVLGRMSFLDAEGRHEA